LRTPPSTIVGTPIAEVDISCGLVVALLKEQHPDLAHLPPQLIGEGWDNAIFRLGKDLAMRLPRRTLGANLIGHEQTWLPRLAARLPIAVPYPLRVGVPGCGYPWNWSIVPWLPGQAADLNEPVSDQADVLGTFLRSLHIPPPADAPVNPWRGRPLSQRTGTFEERLARLSSKGRGITRPLSVVWETGLNAPIDVPSTWLHGDLHPANVLVEQGKITGIIDWGDMTAGDCATDLASVWMLFQDKRAHAAFRSSYGEISEPTLQRAKAWAVFFGVMLLDAGVLNNPRNEALGKRILENLS
jgi:aminoglycoside phosphotransferase (APT) family kinase protein